MNVNVDHRCELFCMSCAVNVFILSFVVYVLTFAMGRAWFVGS